MIKQFRSDFFRHRVVVVVDKDSSRAFRKVLKTFPKLAFNNLPEIEDEYLGAAVFNIDSRVFVWFSALTPNYISHEAVHIAYNFFEMSDIKKIDEELLAYTVGDIVEKIWKLKES